MLSAEWVCPGPHPVFYAKLTKCINIGVVQKLNVIDIECMYKGVIKGRFMPSR